MAAGALGLVAGALDLAAGALALAAGAFGFSVWISNWSDGAFVFVLLAVDLPNPLAKMSGDPGVRTFLGARMSCFSFLAFGCLVVFFLA